MNKFTFKKGPEETGLRRIGSPRPNVDIKLNKKVIGYIRAPGWQDKDYLWKIRFSVKKKDIFEDGNPNCVWKWFRLSVGFENEESARQYIKENSDYFLKNLDLYCIYDEDSK
jgi:hypothetical protein